MSNVLFTSFYLADSRRREGCRPSRRRCRLVGGRSNLSADVARRRAYLRPIPVYAECPAWPAILTSLAPLPGSAANDSSPASVSYRA
jgi:hypothetical protein